MKQQPTEPTNIPEIDAKYSEDSSIILFEGNTMNLLSSIPDNKIKLIVTSPPYNLGKEYETRTQLRAYLNTQKDTVKELYRILDNDGSICWQVGNYIEKGEVFPLDIYYYDIFKDIGLFLRNRIIWHFGHGLHASKRFSGRYETILWFTKSDKYIFNLDDVRTPSKYPGKTHFKGPNKGKPSGNPKGKNPSDYWELINEEFEKCIIDIPNVKSNHPEKTNHPCQFPIELIERFVLAFTNPGDIVLDPYAGVGTTLIAAIMNDRKAIGSEKEPEYCKTARDRIQSYFSGTLPYRNLGKPIFVPTGREKVSQIPKDWEQ